MAVITGASRGLGLLLAAELACRGARLVARDVTSPDAAPLLLAAAREHYRRLDIMIANAGLIRVGPMQSASAADFETAVATMALAPARLALGLMRTGSHVQARFAGRREHGFTWFSLGASLPLVSMDAKRADHQIVVGWRPAGPRSFVGRVGQKSRLMRRCPRPRAAGTGARITWCRCC